MGLTHKLSQPRGNNASHAVSIRFSELKLQPLSFQQPHPDKPPITLRAFAEAVPAA